MLWASPAGPSSPPRSPAPPPVRSHLPSPAPPARPATSSARSPSATRAGSPASATARRSTAGGTGARTGAQPPSPSNNGTLRAWPDMRDYTARLPDRLREPRQRPAGHAVLVLRPADGRHALPVDAAERLRHRRAAAVQPDRRRGPDPRRDDRQGAHRGRGVRPQVLHHVRRHRLDEHAVGDQDRLDARRCRRYTASPAYARQNGKPVVCIWGFGFNDNNHPWDAGHLPGRHQLVQGPGLLRHRRRAARVAHRHRRLAGRLSPASTTRST